MNFDLLEVYELTLRAVARPKNGGGEICWPILSILTATGFSCILEFLLSCPRIRGGGRLLCLSLATALSLSNYVLWFIGFMITKCSFMYVEDK